MIPDWYGVRYPTLSDLEQLAEGLGIRVVVDGVPRPSFIRGEGEGPLILLPTGRSPMAHVWNLAHELGHAIYHEGPSKVGRSKQEAQANRWAACALIPEARIRHHQNACEDAFIAALSFHFEDIPFENCPSRKLAARIARYRMRALESPCPA